MNSICKKQNESSALALLATQGALYSKAKIALAVQIALTIPIATAASIIASLYPNTSTWAAILGLSIAILDASVLDYIQTSLKNQAATIQEQFDCEVLSIPWNDFKVDHPDPELVCAAAVGSNALHDWYPTAVCDLPLSAARLICQRCNLWWDKSLRTGYRTGLMVLTTILFSAALVTGLYTNLTVEKFVLAVLAPLAPMILWIIKEYRRQSASISELQRIKHHLEDTWRRILGGTLTELEATAEARQIQNDLFDRRRTNPLIFDWVYLVGRNKKDSAMNTGAQELVRQFKQTRRGTTPSEP